MMFIRTGRRSELF